MRRNAWKAKSNEAGCGSGYSADSKADIGRHLHSGRPGYGLAEGHTISEGTAVQPLSFVDRHSPDVSYHGRSAKGGEAQP
jgi:hypothetical protein